MIVFPIISIGSEKDFIIIKGSRNFEVKKCCQFPYGQNSSDLSLSIKRKCCYKDKFKEGTDRSYYNDSKSGLHEILFEIEGNEEGAVAM